MSFDSNLASVCVRSLRAVKRPLRAVNDFISTSKWDVRFLLKHLTFCVGIAKSLFPSMNIFVT